MDPLFLVHKFSSDNVPTTLVCPQCEEAFKRFPTTPRWTDNKFRCPVCDGSDEEDLPFRGTEETKRIDEILQELNMISTI